MIVFDRVKTRITGKKTQSLTEETSQLKKNHPVRVGKCAFVSGLYPLCLEMRLDPCRACVIGTTAEY